MKTLILIDVQRDFLPGGALPVPHGDEIIPLINRLMPQFDHVVATQDWHPLNHVSFRSSSHKKEGENLWPDHCIQGTAGAELAPGLDVGKIEKIFYKGTDVWIDSYSAFFDNERRKQTGLAAYLRKKHLNDLHFAGLATDYCVLYSVLDALELGFQASVIQNGCRAIDPEGGKRALQEMKRRGAQIAIAS